jgi:D-glycero-alpha-D-manno-heptose-7-phosphate kinase
MIITRSPLRLSIGGGGTDLPSYYREHEGYLIAMGIEQYVYVSLQRLLQPGILLKYSRLELVDSVDSIQHPIIRECLDYTGLRENRLEITSVADIPAGTGLGSSGSFTTALLKAIHVLNNRHIVPAELAAQACEIELDRLQEPIGKQDQYIAAFGGLTEFTFCRDGRVEAVSLPVSPSVFSDLQENMCLFFTGKTRSASTILRDQDTRTKAADEDIVANLHRVKAMGYDIRQAFVSGNLRLWGEIMREHWETKKRRSAAMSTPIIDEAYDLALRNGAIGGKLVGAGGGGFLLFYAEDPRKLRQAMAPLQMQEVRVRIDVEGTKVVAK